MKTYILRPVSLLALPLMLLISPVASRAQISISVHFGPPALPLYVQPPLPGPGYIWTPGYWAYGPDGYYWVPGTWVLPPAVGLLWTPGYWGWSAGLYVWHPGYWGPHIGFYGGINYGYGYVGVGFLGGEWRRGAFYYNTAVCNVGGVHVTNVYNRTVIVNRTVTNVSFNGGPGGASGRPTLAEEAAAHDRHIQGTRAQFEHEHMASANRAQLASVNHGRPAVAASPRPGVFNGRGVVEARATGPGRAPTAGTSGRMNFAAKPPAGAGPHPPVANRSGVQRSSHLPPPVRTVTSAPKGGPVPHKTPPMPQASTQNRPKPASRTASQHH